MTKITLTLAAALLAGTTLTSAANAGGLRVGFGFPLGSFIAHSAQNSMDDGYSRRYERRRRVYEAERAPVRKAKPVSKVATVKPVAKQVIKTAKLEDKLSSDPATTTEIAKTSDVTTASTTPASTPAPAATTNTTTAETAKVEKVATVDKTTTEAKSNTSETAPAKQICRRYSAAIAGLVDVPCNE
jgi:hypothetical protein